MNDSTQNNTKLNVDIGATNSAKAVLSGAIKDFSQFWKTASGGSDAEQAAGSFEKLAASVGLSAGPMGIAAVAVGVVAAGVVAAGVASVKAAAAFQQATTTLTTTAGVAEGDLKAMRQGILDIASATGTATDQAAQAMYTIASAGFNATKGAKDGLDVLKAAAEGAKTENADLNTVAKAVSATMVDYHQNANQAANTTSKLVAAVGAGGATFEEYAGALHSVLPIASAAHISLNDILGDVAEMTKHEMSADQATQNLAEAIRTLQAPSQSAQQYLYSIGINAANLNQELSSKGLSGTLEEISTAIMNHMGPSGKVLISSFNQSKAAAADLNIMLNAMTPALRKIAEAYENGDMSVSQFRQTVKDTNTQQAAQLVQFQKLADQAHGFNNLLKSGTPDALSYSQALQKATGNATTMNVALMLTGENAKDTAKAVKTVGEAHAEAGGHVKGWSDVQNNLNQQMAEFKQTINATAISLGTLLLPAVTGLVKGLNQFLLGSLQVINGVNQMIAKFQSLGGLVGQLRTIGAQLVGGLVDGILHGPNPANVLVGLGQGAVNAFKKVLGIHSPSKVFADIGQNMGQGLVQGLNSIQDKAQIAVNAMVTGGGMVTTGGKPGMSSSSVVNNSTTNNTGGATTNVFNVSLGSAAAVQQFFKSVNQDSININRGLTPIQGAH